MDKNHPGIVKGLRAVGCTVVSLAGVGFGTPDLLVGRSGQTWLFEVKDEDGTLRPSQADWNEGWRGAPPITIRTLNDALQALGLTGLPAAMSGVERFYPGK